MPVSMFIAGYPIPGPDVLDLARLVTDPDLAERLKARTAERSTCSRSTSRTRSDDLGPGRAVDQGARRAPAVLLESTSAGCATGSPSEGRSRGL